MIELPKKLDLNINLGNNELIYDKAEFEPAVDWVKNFKDGQYAYKNPTGGPDPLYYGARYAEKTADEKIFVENDFMLDLTVLNPGQVGDEYVKTVGHYHGLVPGKDYSFPEVYEVISGKIEYLLQSEPDQDGAVEVIWVVAEEGDKVVMPPNYGHVSMNVGPEPAIEIDLQKRDNPNNSDYSMFKEKVGGAYYRTSEGQEPNPNYKIKSFRVVKPKERPDLGLEKGKTTYQLFTEAPEKFEWLKDPSGIDLLDSFVNIEQS